jgi:hypothetical protein
MRNQLQPFAVSGGANVQSAHENTKQGLCSDAFFSFFAKLSDRKTKPTVELMACDQF